MALSSCDDNLVFEQNTEIEDSVWNWNSPVSYDFNIEDTVRLHDFYINLRNGSDYEYSNIYLFVTLYFPNGKKSVDTLECFLADPMGGWYGSGIGDVYDNRFLYKQRKAFPLAGEYSVSINQAMREENLGSIHDVGFRLSLSK